MNFFRRSDFLLLLPLLLCCCSAPMHAQNSAMYGQSITWRPARSPFAPDASNGAIMGGPGADPNPGSPMYICRARMQNSMVPGKWVQGNCNVAFGGSEQIMRSYEVAYGSARWGGYRGTSYGLAQTGSRYPTAARSIPAAFTTSTLAATATAISPASLYPTELATSRSAARRSSRIRPFKSSMQRAADVLPSTCLTTPLSALSLSTALLSLSAAGAAVSRPAIRRLPVSR